MINCSIFSIFFKKFWRGLQHNLRIPQPTRTRARPERRALRALLRFLNKLDSMSLTPITSILVYYITQCLRTASH
nr:hypothetical protein [Cressdnaviricota sp.]